MTQIVTVDDDDDDDRAENNNNNDDDNDVPSWPLANDCIYEAEPHILWLASLLPFIFTMTMVTNLIWMVFK